MPKIKYTGGLSYQVFGTPMLLGEERDFTPREAEILLKLDGFEVVEDAKPTKAKKTQAVKAKAAKRKATTTAKQPTPKPARVSKPKATKTGKQK